MSYFYLLTGPPGERELAALELWVLAGVEAAGVCAEGAVAADVSGAAYTRFCAETLATGRSLEELAAATQAANLVFDQFRIEVYRPAPKAPEGRTEIARRVADALLGRPNLSFPQVRLAVVAQPGAWRLGRIVSASRQDWRQWRPPANFSAALPAQMARALVNLVAAPGDTLLDPCCGMGTVVAQAAQRGVRAVGVEISKKLAGRAAAAIRAGGGGGLIVAGDGRCLGGRAEAAVVDLPYGRTSKVAPGLYRDLLANVARLARRVVVVAAQPVEETLEAAGLRLLRRARAQSGRLTRHVYLTRSEGYLREGEPLRLARFL